MAKYQVSVIILAVLLSVGLVSAKPFISKEAISAIRMKVSTAIDALVEQDQTGMAKTMVQKFREPINAAIDKFLEHMPSRKKRSIHANYAVTKVNATTYQKVEVNRTWDKDPQEKSEPACLVKENEVLWLEYLTSVMIFISQEMKKVIDGKPVPYKMPRDVYNQQKANF